nr:tRNA lysidine(34) synthetase TilS [Anaerotignum lactatifermentans]
MEKVRWTMKQYHMCGRGERIAVGVSGGADSMALLHLLWRLSVQEEWQVQAVHVHHGLRGAEADADAAYVEETCRCWGIPCTVIRLDVAAEAAKRKLGVEETGRILRYEALRQAAAGGKIAVAHHANDQAETLLMRLCRGTGMQGLAAMRPVREDVIRPLLFCGREEIEVYCRQKGILWREDSTNRETAYTRNRLRHQVLPLLEQVHGGSIRHLSEAAELLAAEEDFLEKEAQKALAALEERGGLWAAALLELHPALRRRVLRLAVAQKGSLRDVTRSHILQLEELLEKESGKSICLPHGLWAGMEYGRLVLKRQEMAAVGFCHSLEIGGQTAVPELGWLVETEVSLEKPGEFCRDDYTNVFDYDKIKRELCCRSRRPGDRMALRAGSKKLKDLFIDEKIPREERDRKALIACGGEVLWIVGGRISPAVLPEKDTKRYITVRIRRV